MIYLASRSPRRRELLTQMGVDFKVIPVDVDETPVADESPEDYVVRVAIDKAEAGFNTDHAMPVLAADTAVICNRQIIGKPRNRSDFLDIFASLSNNTHQVITGVAVIGNAPGPHLQSALSINHVEFGPVNQTRASRYWETGEPQDKAGGYAIQGLGAVFVRRINGSYSGIMGLPVYETAELLRTFNIHCL